MWVISYSICLSPSDISLSIKSLSPSMLLQMAKFHAFCGWAVFRYLLHILYPFICSWTVCFHIFAVISGAAMNTDVHVSFQISVFIFSPYIPGVELLGHAVVLFFAFWAILLSTLAAPIYSPANSAQGSSFLHIFANVCYLCSLWW